MWQPCHDRPVPWNHARVRSLLAGFLLLTPFLVACGGEERSDGGDDDDATLVAEMADDLVRANDPGGDEPSLITEDDGRCIAEGLLADPGREALEDAAMLGDGGYTPPDGVSAEVADPWAPAHASCIDLRDNLVATSRLIIDGLADEPAPERAWQEALECVRSEVSEEEAAEAFAAAATGERPSSDPDDAFNTCLGPVSAGLG
jgi:hypothetical protein